MFGPAGIEVITTEEPGGWDAVLREIGVYLFYYLASFHRLSELRGHGKAEMLVFREGGYTIIFPMLVRDVDLPPIVSAHDGLKDATSVPGLVGPLASAPTVPEHIRKRFILALQAYFEENRIITAYSRLNCLLDRPPLFDGYGQTVSHGVEISLDLTIPEEEQFARYRKDTRKDVRRLIRDGFTFEEVGAEFLDEFIRIYTDTMDRKNAAPAYYFRRAIFEYLMNDMSDVTHIFISRHVGKVAAVGMYLECNGIVHAYLSGIPEEYIRQSPSKLLTDGVRKWAVERGCTMFHMGAGDQNQRDSLWDFKMAFGGREHEYCTWRHVADPGVYEDICREAAGAVSAEVEDSYFPRYRHPALRR